MNTAQFEAQMKVHGDTLSTLAEKIGICKSTLCHKKNGKSDFTQTEIFKIKNLYQLSPGMLNEIFFAS